MMSAALILCTAAALSWLGFSLLSLAMERHYGDVMGRSRKPPVRPLRIGGWLGLSLSLLACVWRDGWAVGATTWFGIAALAALLMAMVHAYQPRWLVGSTIAAAGLASVASVAAMLL